MLRHSERISNNYKSMPYNKLKHLTDAYQNNMKKNGTKNNRIYILKLLYNTVYSEFYEIRYDIHNTTAKKEDFFIHFIKTLEKKGRVLLDELTQPDNQGITSSKALTQIILKTGNKIRKYIDTYNNEKKEAFILLSSFIGIDIVKNIQSYL